MVTRSWCLVGRAAILITWLRTTVLCSSSPFRRRLRKILVYFW